MAEQEGTGVAEFLDEDSCQPDSPQQQRAWREFVDEVRRDADAGVMTEVFQVAAILREDDEKYYELITKVASSTHFSGQRAGAVGPAAVVQHSIQKVWDLSNTNFRNVLGELSLLLLPLVLFVPRTAETESVQESSRRENLGGQHGRSARSGFKHGRAVD
eukprot:762994-Hanusia_phi.AAC.12